MPVPRTIAHSSSAASRTPSCLSCCSSGLRRPTSKLSANRLRQTRSSDAFPPNKRDRARPLTRAGQLSLPLRNLSSRFQSPSGPMRRRWRLLNDSHHLLARRRLGGQSSSLGTTQAWRPARTLIWAPCKTPSSSCPSWCWLCAPLRWNWSGRTSRSGCPCSGFAHRPMFGQHHASWSAAIKTRQILS